MTNLENRIQDAYNKLSIEEKYKLLENMEKKHLGTNEKYDSDFMENIVNTILDITTIVAKVLHII